jgi:hypothetical protein
MSHLICPEKKEDKHTRLFYYKLSLQKSNDSDYQQDLKDSLLEYFNSKNLVKIYGWNLYKPGSGILEIRCVLQFQNKITTPRLSGNSSLPGIIPLYPKQISIKELKPYFPSNLSKEKVIFASSTSQQWQTLKEEIELLSEREYKNQLADARKKRNKQEEETREEEQDEEAEEPEGEVPTKKLKISAESITYIFDITL